MEIVAESEPAELLASIVMDVADATVVGVPVMAPVLVENDRPLGSEPLVIDQLVAAPPVLVGEAVEIAVFFVKVNGEPA
jgi:hypothetical protein